MSTDIITIADNREASRNPLKTTVIEIITVKMIDVHRLTTTELNYILRTYFMRARKMILATLRDAAKLNLGTAALYSLHSS